MFYLLKAFLFFLLISFSLLFPVNIFAQVVINEFSSATSNDDWVEIYNNSSEATDLFSYSLVDGSSSGNTKTFSCILAPRGFFVVGWSNKLNNGGDIIKLKNDNTVVDCVAYKDGAGQVCEGKTAIDLEEMNSGEFGARLQDGASSWAIITTPTKDGSNDGSGKDSGAVCNTPTPTPEPTPTSSSSPTPTLTPTPTKTPTATPKPTVKAATTKKPKVISTKTTSDEEESEVLGLREGLEIPSPSPTPESEEKGKIPITAVLFVLGGLGFMGVAGYPFLKSIKKRYNIENEGKEAAEKGPKPGDSQEGS